MSVKAFLDTNIIVYAYDLSAGSKRTLARKLLTRLWDEGTGSLSIQVLQELYVTLTRKAAVEPKTGRVVVAHYGMWRLHRPSANDVVDAIDLHQKGLLSLWDAMILVSARKLACDVLYTEDLNHGQRVLGVEVINPFLAE